jgi:hypothetical protein
MCVSGGRRVQAYHGAQRGRVVHVPVRQRVHRRVAQLAARLGSCRFSRFRSLKLHLEIDSAFSSPT